MMPEDPRGDEPREDGSKERTSDRERRLDAVLAAYLDAVDRGVAPAREELLACHPELAGELGAFLDGMRDLEALAAAADTLPVPAGERETDPTLSLEGPPIGGVPDRLRYFGDYEIVAEIARGGMGVVYRARQVSLNRPVAVKMILSETLPTEEEVRRFRAESEAAAALEHPGIVPIYEVGEHEGRQYYSMKLLEGGSLATERERFSDDPHAAAELTRAVAVAVHHGHQRGVLHRDLKPANILLDVTGRPHVADFGLAKRVDDERGLTRTGAVLGTPAYMAPEQAAGRSAEITTATDIWSIGAILYYILSGRPPFRGPTPVETLRRVVQEEPAPPSRERRGVPRDLETICLKCLEKDPERRYGSAEALAEDLGRFLRGEPILARPASPADRIRKWMRRRPAAAALVAVSVLALTALLVGLLLFLGRERQLRREVEASLVRTRALGLAAVSHNVERRGPHVTNLLLAREAVRYAELPWTVQRLRDALDTPPRLVAEFTPNVMFACFSPAGNLVAATGSDLVPGVLRLFDTSGVEVARFGEDCRVERAAFSPEGDRVVTTCADGTARLWDTRGRELAVLRGHTARITSAIFSPDGTRILTASWDETLRLWDLDGQQQVVIQHGGRPFAVAFSPDGTRIASTHRFDPEEARLWDLRGRRLAVLRHGGEVRSVAFSADGSTLLTASEDGAARLWNVGTDRPDEIRALRGHEGGLVSAVWSPDGKRILTASVDGTARLWDPDGNVLAVVRGHEGKVYSAVFSVDGNRILTASADGTARLWDTQGRELAVVGRNMGGSWPVRFPPAVFSPDGRLILLVGGGWARLRDASPPATLLLRPGPAETAPGEEFAISSAAFLEDGGGVLTWSDADSTARIWRFDGTESVILDGLSPRIFDPVAPPGGSLYLFATRHQTLRILARGTASPGALRGHTGEVLSVAVSSDATLFLTGAADGTARLWDATGRQVAIARGHAGPVRSVALAPDGSTFLSGSDDGTARLWDADGHEIVVLRGHKAPVTGVAFARDGLLLLTASSDGTARLWHENGEPARVLSGDGAPLSSGSICRDGSHALILSENGGARLWNLSVATSSPVPLAAGPFLRARFSPAGDRVLTVSLDGVVAVWTSDGKKAGAWKPPGDRVRCAVVSPGGERVLVGTEGGRIHIRSLEDGSTAEASGDDNSLAVSSSAVAGLAWAEDGLHAAFICEDGTRGDITFEAAPEWRVSGSGSHCCLPGAYGEVFSRGGGIVVTTADGVVRLWDVEGRSLTFLRGHGKDVVDVDLSRDGTRILTAAEDGTARLWDRQGREVCICRGHEDALTSAAFSPDGLRVVTASDDGTARLWDLEGNGTAVFRGHEARIYTAAFSPDGAFILTASRDKTARIWNLEGETTAVLRGHERELVSAVFSPAGDHVLTTGWDDTARLWSLDGREIAVLHHQAIAAPAAVFAPDGRHIISYYRDHAVVWDPAGNELQALASPGGWTGLPVFSDNGRRTLLLARKGGARVAWLRSADLLRLADERLARDFTREEIRRHADLLSEETRARVPGEAPSAAR